ncbi:MAG: preprotein translocase subunit SecY [Actinobacteria bacterium]|nr:preprotein translocase subunit SecY [Actinomycetota bacterium]HRY09517.1 preprotein translocase subunit SecY [Candidatus Nanopelagicales bacterium]
MLSQFAAAFRTPDLRNKILFTLGLIAIYRVGAIIPTPGVDYTAIQTCLTLVEGNSLYGLINLFSGGALLQLSVFALGIMPYITASIIIQLLTVVIPRLEALRKEGQSGQAKMTQYTRYLTIALSVLQATAFVSLARTPGQLFTGCNENLIPNQSIPLIITMIIVMTAGAAMLMWFGELITDRGVGNGMSLLIFVSIIAGMPGQFYSIYQTRGTFILLLTLAVGVVIIAAVVYVEQAQRRIPVQYAKKMVGSRLMGGASTYIPLKVNMAGVIPVIFASSLLYIPQLLATVSGNTNSEWGKFIARNLSRGTEPLYVLFYVAMIIFFAYFYVSITFNPVEVSDNMKKYGGFIPGIRAGKPTEQYLAYVLSRLTFPGSIYLAVVAVIPLYAFGSLGVGQSFIFGGTSLLIMVGVGLDTVKQIEAQLQQRSYEGFLR